MSALPRETFNSLQAVGHGDEDLQDAAGVLAVYDAATGLLGIHDGHTIRDWVGGVLDLLTALEPSEKVKWDNLRVALDNFSSLCFGGGLGVGRSRSDEADLLDLSMLADLTTICGQSNRCAPRARDIVGRFFRKSIEQGAFFRDVRLTPTHFDELVALAAPHFPEALRSPVAMPAQWRFFCCSFLDVAEGTAAGGGPGCRCCRVHLFQSLLTGGGRAAAWPPCSGVAGQGRASSNRAGLLKAHWRQLVRLAWSVCCFNTLRDCVIACIPLHAPFLRTAALVGEDDTISH